jgi:hypothetical protein
MKSIELENPSKTPDNKLTFRIAEAHTVLFAGLAIGATVEFATTHTCTLLETQLINLALLEAPAAVIANVALYDRVIGLWHKHNSNAAETPRI